MSDDRLPKIRVFFYASYRPNEVGDNHNLAVTKFDKVVHTIWAHSPSVDSGTSSQSQLSQPLWVDHVVLQLQLVVRAHCTLTHSRRDIKVPYVNYIVG